MPYGLVIEEILLLDIYATFLHGMEPTKIQILGIWFTDLKDYEVLNLHENVL